MSVSVQQILGEARRLVGRLREQDVSADQLLAHAHALGQNVETMRQYNEELTQLTENSNVGTGLPRPRAALVLSIQQENRHIRELQQENRELVATLKEHQSALELIMAKYREQVTRLGSTCQVEEKLGLGASLPAAMAALPQCHHLADKVCEMAAVMRRAAEVDEERDSKHTELLVQLRAENGILRRLLEIGNKVGSAGLTDEESQTENVGLVGDASSTAPNVAQ